MNRVAALGIVSAGFWGLLLWITLGLPPDWVDSLIELSPDWAHSSLDELKHGFNYEVENIDTPTIWYLILFTLLWALSVLAVWKVSGWKATWMIIGFGVAFRIIMLFSEPIHENDFYRYLWDGKSLINGVNPYLYEPAALYMYEQGIEEEHFEPITETTLRGRPWTTGDIERLKTLQDLRDENPTPFYRIGHWQVPTIYPPTAQLMFGTSQALFGDSLVGFRVVLLLFDLASMGLILVLLRKLGRNPAWIIFYAWSPLIIVEFINSAHLDIMPIAFTLLAIVLAINGRQIPAAAGLAVGILGKYFSGFLFPILIRPNWRGVLIYIVSVAVVLLAFAPFVVWQGAGLEVFRGLGVYTERWQNNSGAFLLIDQMVSLFVPAAADTYIYGKVVVALLFLGFIAYLAFTKTPDHDSMIRKCFCVLAMFFFLNPTAFPWYFGWVIPLLCVFPKPSWLVLSLTLQLYYLDFHEEYPIIYKSWLGIPVLNWIAWGSFGVVWIIETVTTLLRNTGRRNDD